MKQVETDHSKMGRLTFHVKRPLLKSDAFCLSIALVTAVLVFSFGFQYGAMDSSGVANDYYGYRHRLSTGRRLSNVHIIEEIDDGDDWEGVELRRRVVKPEIEENGANKPALLVKEADLAPAAEEKRRPKSQNEILGISTECPKMARLETNVVLYNSLTMCASHVLLNMAKYANNELFVEDLKDPLHKSSHPERDLLKYVEQKPRPSLFHFHTRYCHISSNEDRSVSYISMVRNPLDRLVAQYHADMRVFTKAGVKVKSYSECVASHDKMCVGNWTRNTIVRHFCGYDPRCETPSTWAFEMARANIADNYLVVGIVSEYERFLQLLERLAPTVFKVHEDSGADMSKVLDKRIFESALDELSDEAKARMEKHVEMDLKMYNFIRERFRKQLQICGLG